VRASGGSTGGRGAPCRCDVAFAGGVAGVAGACGVVVGVFRALAFDWGGTAGCVGPSRGEEEEGVVSGGGAWCRDDVALAVGATGLAGGSWAVWDT
jgi:hypothetical protein